MKTAAIAILIVAFLSPALYSEPKRGTICVSAQPDHFPSNTLIWGDVHYNPATHKLRMDKGEAIAWPHKQDLKIADLDLTGRHLITIISDGKPIQSVWFEFSHFHTTDLCLEFDSYAAIQIGSTRHSLCKCK